MYGKLGVAQRTVRGLLTELVLERAQFFFNHSESVTSMLEGDIKPHDAEQHRGKRRHKVTDSIHP